MKNISINDWLLAQVMLMQAMIGAISKNFRQVSLEVKDKHWLSYQGGRLD